MLTAHHLYKSYNILPVLKDISFSINSGERVGLIGPNGSGKTTLLRILAGLEIPDQGTVTHSPAGLRLGYLAQGFRPDENQPVHGVIRAAAGDPDKIEAEVERLALELSREPGRIDLQTAYDSALQRLQDLSQAESGRIPALLSALGLASVDDERPVSTLSGGQKTRLALARVLLGSPQLLLLDEPTNHLDIQML
ncbi:MAG: ATP-binding cassette domain-containing protein, partial [Omnitrophica WOR_2 bacterium]